MTKISPHQSHAKGRTRTGHFACDHCEKQIPRRAPGTRHRNHCPYCLWSVHVDHTPGDRAAACRAPMAPVAVATRPDGEWSLIHRCTACGTLKANRIAGDDDEQALLKLALRPLAALPFPIT